MQRIKKNLCEKCQRIYTKENIGQWIDPYLKHAFIRI